MQKGRKETLSNKERVSVLVGDGMATKRTCANTKMQSAACRLLSHREDYQLHFLTNSLC